MNGHDLQPFLAPRENLKRLFRSSESWPAFGEAEDLLMSEVAHETTYSRGTFDRVFFVDAMRSVTELRLDEGLSFHSRKSLQATVGTVAVANAAEADGS